MPEAAAFAVFLGGLAGRLRQAGTADAGSAEILAEFADRVAALSGRAAVALEPQAPLAVCRHWPAVLEGLGARWGAAAGQPPPRAQLGAEPRPSAGPPRAPPPPPHTLFPPTHGPP